MKKLWFGVVAVLLLSASSAFARVEAFKLTKSSMTINVPVVCSSAVYVNSVTFPDNSSLSSVPAPWKMTGPSSAEWSMVQAASSSVVGSSVAVNFLSLGLKNYAETPLVLLSPLFTSSAPAAACFPFAVSQYQMGVGCSTPTAFSFQLIGKTPVITSTVTITPSGSSTLAGYVPGSTGSDIRGSVYGGQEYIFYVAHTGNLAVTVNVRLVMTASLSLEYRLSPSGSWTVLDAESYTYAEPVSLSGNVPGISGYAEVRLTATDYDGGVAEASLSSAVFVP